MIGDQSREEIYIPRQFITIHPRPMKGTRRLNKNNSRYYVLTSVAEEVTAIGGLRRVEVWTEL